MVDHAENNKLEEIEYNPSGSSGFKKFSQTIINTIKDFSTDKGTQWAAAISYYSLLSIFPLLLAAITILAFLVSPEWASQQITAQLRKFFPTDLSQINSIIKGAIEARGTASIISIVSLLWSGTSVFATIHTALNVAYGVEKSFGFFKGALFKFIMLLGIALLFIVAYGAQYAISFLGSQLKVYLPDTQFIVSILLQFVFAILLFFVFFLLYRYVPMRLVEWQAAAGGALLATLLFVAARALFVVYIQNFTHYSLIYGSIAALIIIIFWIWIMAVILILGGELVANIQRFYFGDKFVSN